MHGNHSKPLDYVSRLDDDTNNIRDVSLLRGLVEKREQSYRISRPQISDFSVEINFTQRHQRIGDR